MAQPETSTMPEQPATTDDSKALAVRNEISALTTAIEVYLGTRELIPDYDARATRAITSGQAFTKPPTDDTEQETILQAQRAIASLRKEAEKAALAYRAPLNAGAKAIIAIETAAEKVLVAEEKRLAGLINNYQQKIAEARQQQAKAEAERERERLAKEDEAERKRIAAENASKAAEEARQRAEEANTPAAKKKAQEEADRLAREAQEKDDAAFAAETAAQAQRPVETVPISDHAAREFFDFTLKGRNDSEKRDSLIKLLFAHTQFFGATIKEGDGGREYTLRLKIQDLKDALNGTAPFAKIESAPGIEITKHLSRLR